METSTEAKLEHLMRQVDLAVISKIINKIYPNVYIDTNPEWDTLYIDPEEQEEYEKEFDILIDDLCLTERDIEKTSDINVKKSMLLNLLGYVDSRKESINKSWPDIPIKEIALAELQKKYDTYDGLYDELLIL